MGDILRATVPNGLLLTVNGFYRSRTWAIHPTIYNRQDSFPFSFGWGTCVYLVVLFIRENRDLTIQ
jgi:hypothetical protein